MACCDTCAETGTSCAVEKNFRPVRKIKFQGLDISIEHDKGDVRPWRDRTGKSGATKMRFPYGYVRRTTGADDEQIDVYVGPDENSTKVYIVHQMTPPNFKRYDEDKVMVGFNSRREAQVAYLVHYNDERFLGTITETTIDAFKRTYVKKSAGGWFEEIRRSEGDPSPFWNALRKSLEKAEDKPTKTWVRNSAEDCRTGVCDRLDGTSVNADDKFEAMNGMMVDGPPAHLSCKCTLEFTTTKSMNPMQMNQAPQMPMIVEDPHDCESYEGCDRMLGNLWNVKDDELMQIAEKIWGSGYTYHGQDPIKARMEIRGWLLDQQDLLQFAPPQPTMSDLMPALDDGDQPQEPPSTDSSSGQTTTENRSPDGSLLQPASKEMHSETSPEQDFSQKQEDPEKYESTP